MTNDNNLPVLILGGGPAGLTAAYELVKVGRNSVVLEKDRIVGGIARTESYKGYRFDIGGHRFFTKVDEVRDFWYEVLQEDFLTRPRMSRIFYDNRFYYYPLRLSNVLKNLGVSESFLIFLSYLHARVSPYPQENSFEEWVSNRFGSRLYQIFFKTYTEKVWGMPCNQISADWAAQRIKDLSFVTALRNAILGQQGNTITTLIEQFEYPRLGPGMLWEQVQRRVEEAGNPVMLQTEVTAIHQKNNRVEAVTVADARGSRKISGNHCISSIPLSQLILRLDPPPPADVIEGATRLTYRDFLTVILIVNKKELFPDNWIYIHSPEVKVGRIQNFKNWSEDMVPDPNKTSLGLEYFCTEGDALWLMSDEALIELGKTEIAKVGLAQCIDVQDGVVFRQKKAYPVYTGEYKAYLEKIKTYLDGFENLQTVGRNGLHMYNNQDHSMLTAMLAVENILGENHDVWSVNVERAYHEEIRAPSGAG